MERLAELESSAALRHRLSRVFGREFVAAAASMFAFTQRQGCYSIEHNLARLRTRYRTKLGWFFWFWPIQRYDTTMGKWQILCLRTRCRSKLGWFFWFGSIHVTIHRNLALIYQLFVSLPGHICQHLVTLGNTWSQITFGQNYP